MSDLATKNGFKNGQPAGAESWTDGQLPALLEIGTEKFSAL
jgi:hypothetical protein